MLTYDLSRRDGVPLYEALYRRIRADILDGALPAGEKLPSKRALAENLEVSKITVEAAYSQLLSEGYICSKEKVGYFVETVERRAPVPDRMPAVAVVPGGSANVFARSLGIPADPEPAAEPESSDADGPDLDLGQQESAAPVATDFETAATDRQVPSAPVPDRAFTVAFSGMSRKAARSLSMPSRLPLLFRKIFVVSSPISSVASSAQVSRKVYWLRFLSKGSNVQIKMI